MNKLIIPPSPNWYEPNILACAPDNTLLYGSRNCIIILPLGEVDDLKIISQIHSQRVICVATSPNWGKPNKFGLSVGEDNVVCFLDLENYSLKLSHEQHVSNPDKVVGATFTSNGKIVSVSENGLIVIWHTESNKFTILNNILGIKTKVSSMSMCPHSEWLAAFGSKLGAVIITDLNGAGKVLYTINAYEYNILSLAWCPAPQNIFAGLHNRGQPSNETEGKIVDKNKKDFLLASSARNSNLIKIWRAGTDGLLETEINLSGNDEKKKNMINTDSVWVTVVWITPKDLVSSSKNGQLLHWKLTSEMIKKFGRLSYKYNLINNERSKYVVSITAPIRKYDFLEDEDWRDKNMLNVWSAGRDRFIRNTDISNNYKILKQLSHIGGNIHCFAASPIDPNRIAISMGELPCKLWNLSSSQIVLSDLFYVLRVKISTLIWHPLNENCLVYGTFDGQIGVVDTSKSFKVPKLLVKSSHATICKMEWGPLKENCDVLVLYVLCSGKLLTYNIKNVKDEPTHIDLDEKIFISYFSWKSDYSILAVATKSANILLYNKQLQLISSAIFQTKVAYYISWHPSGNSEDSWLAVSNNDVIVYDTSLIKETNNCANYVVANFSIHIKPVHCLTWNPHKSGMLASASEDGAVYVWDVKSKILLYSCYNFDLDPFIAILWSPFDSDYIITGGKNSLIQIWKLSENLARSRPEVTIKRKHNPKKTKEKNIIEDSKPTSNRKNFFSSLSKIQNASNSAVLNDCKRLLAELREKRLDYKREEKFDVLRLFGDKEDIDNLLNLEKSCQESSSFSLYYDTIEMWQGNIGETIKNAIASESLNKRLVSIAPMVSYSLWQEACATYAKQLTSGLDCEPMEAAFYYLACHKIEDAINVLRKAHCYREALVLAKCRLQPSDPIITDIILSWAKYCTMVGNYELAVQCYIVLDKIEDAAKVLFRRSDRHSLQFCVELAKDCGNDDLLSAVLYRLNSIENSESDNQGELTSLMSRIDLELKNADINREASDIDSEASDVDNK